MRFGWVSAKGIALWLCSKTNLLAESPSSSHFLPYSEFITANQSFFPEGHSQNESELAAEPTASISRKEQLPQKAQKMLSVGS